MRVPGSGDGVIAPTGPRVTRCGLPSTSTVIWRQLCRVVPGQGTRRACVTVAGRVDPANAPAAPWFTLLARVG